MFKQFIHYVYPISNFLGGKMKTKQVEVLPYDKKWRIEFEKIKNIIVVLCQYFGHKKSNFFMLHF